MSVADTLRANAGAVEEYEQQLERLARRGDAGLLNASFDLRPAGSGSPIATRILRQAIRDAVPGDGRPQPSNGQLAAIEQVLASRIQDGASAGHAGLFVIGSLDEPVMAALAVAIPPRNRIDVGHVSRFELARHRALTRTPVAVIWADRSDVSWVLVRGDRPPTFGERRTDTHHMSGALGRTAQHGRSGPAGSPSGGHSKTRVEASAEEERERFAREAVGEIGSRLRAAEVIVLHGPPEFTARLREHMPRSMLEHLVTADGYDRRPDRDTLIEEAVKAGVTAQYERAAEFAHEVGSGELVDAAIRGVDAALTAADEGRLAEVVLPEDAAGHFGDAVDARHHQPSADAVSVERLLQAVHDGGARCWFERSQPNDVGEDGVGEALIGDAEALGVLRW